jgi:hypothetical protein
MKRAKIIIGYVRHPKDLLKSPAWGAASLPARRILDRLEVEHISHHGKCNGDLQVSYAQLAAGGVRRRSIPGAVRDLRRLGLLKVRVSTVLRVGQIRPPNLYELTYLETPAGGPTNDWRKITSIKEAKQATARRSRPRLRVLEAHHG